MGNSKKIIPSTNDAYFFRSGDDVFFKYILFRVYTLFFFAYFLSNSISCIANWCRCTPLFLQDPISSHFQSRLLSNDVVSKRKHALCDTNLGTRVHVRDISKGFNSAINISCHVLTTEVHSYTGVAASSL